MTLLISNVIINMFYYVELKCHNDTSFFILWHALYPENYLFTWCSAKNNFTCLYTIIHSFTYMAKGKKFLKYDPKLYMETLQPFTGEALVAMPKTLPKSRLNLVPKSLVNNGLFHEVSIQARFFSLPTL